MRQAWSSIFQSLPSPCLLGFFIHRAAELDKMCVRKRAPRCRPSFKPKEKLWKNSKIDNHIEFQPKTYSHVWKTERAIALEKASLGHTFPIHFTNRYYDLSTLLDLLVYWIFIGNSDGQLYKVTSCDRPQDAAAWSHPIRISNDWIFWSWLQSLVKAKIDVWGASERKRKVWLFFNCA